MLLVNVSPPKQLQALYLDRSHDVEGTGQGQVMYFLANASLPKPLDVVTSNFVPD